MNSHEGDSSDEGNEYLYSIPEYIPQQAVIPQPSANKMVVELQGPSGAAGSTNIEIDLEGLHQDPEQEGLRPGAEYTFDMPIPRQWIEAQLSRLSAAEPLGEVETESASLEASPVPQNAAPNPVIHLNPRSTTILRHFKVLSAGPSVISPWKKPPERYMSFMALPRELRDMVYGLLLIVDKPIRITSPALGKYSYRKIKTRFTSLFGVSKDIGEEARIIFYSRNTWVVGNGQWGSREQPNRHALKIFLERVPRYAIASIRRLQLDIHFTCQYPRSPRSEHKMYPRDVTNLKGLSRPIVKYFKRVDKIVVMSGGDFWTYVAAAPTLKPGPISAMTQLFEMPNLKKIIFLDNVDERSFQNVVDGMLEGGSGEKAKEKSIVVKVADDKLKFGDGYSLGQWDME
ncbi:hypothetical protein IFR05_002776 [Cadophora sp. M221]|nr:hypothetical protein IFR05_002776 [Cadophora sp. M221]